jgi:hypothetical protein
MKKGTRVFLIVDADRKGPVLVKCCTVGAWGAQRVHLLDAITGKPHEPRLYTKQVNTHLFPHIINAEEQPDLCAAALKVAEGFLALHRAHINRIISSEDFEQQNHDYKLAVRAQLAALHEPRVIVAGNEVAVGGES